MKYFWLILIPSIMWADCNSGGFACAVNSNCPLAGTIYAGTWYTPCGTGFCDPSSCHWHQPTYGCPDTQVWTGMCIAGTACGFTFTVSAIGCTTCGAVADCVNMVALCTLGACPSWTPWTNQGCGPVGGCAVGQMSQGSSGSGAPCCGPTVKHQCMASGSCMAPAIITFTALPTTVELGSQVTLTWTLGGGAPASLSIDNGVGPVVGTTVNATPGAIGPLTYTLTASNLIGTVTKTVSITVIAPLPRCGLGQICGIVSAQEKPFIKLPNVVLELRNQSGAALQTTTTGPDGSYAFVGLAAGTYFVAAIPKRSETAAPFAFAGSPNTIIGTADFTMRGATAQVQVSAQAMTFMVFTPAPITTVPAVGIGKPVSFSTVAGTDNQAVIELPGAHDYYLTCQHFPDPLGPSKHINGGATIWPLDHITETCL